MYPNNEKQIVTESVNTATEAHESGRIPFFSTEPLPGESLAETNARKAFLSKASEALSILETSMQDMLSFFIRQKNLFAEMGNNMNRQSFENALWEMFEALMRDEMTAIDTETRAEACVIYRWLHRVTTSIYAV